MFEKLLDFICDPYLIFIFVTVFFLTACYWRWSLIDLPPGPPALPIIGNLLQVAGAGHFYLRLLELQKHYGNIYRLKMGSVTSVILVGHEMIRAALVEKADQFRDRPKCFYIPNQIMGQNRGEFL